MYPSRTLQFQPSRVFRMKNPEEEHRAHTISQRLRTLKRIPPELIPLGVVLGVALGAAAYSVGRKFYVDKQLRLSRSRGSVE